MVLCIRGLDDLYSEYDPTSYHHRLIPAILSSLPSSMENIHLVFHCQLGNYEAEGSSVEALQYRLANLDWGAIGRTIRSLPLVERLTVTATGIEHCNVWNGFNNGLMSTIKQGLISGFSLPATNQWNICNTYSVLGEFFHSYLGQ